MFTGTRRLIAAWIYPNDPIKEMMTSARHVRKNIMLAQKKVSWLANFLHGRDKRTANEISELLFNSQRKLLDEVIEK